MSEVDAASIVRRFADALDNDKYAEAQTLLKANATYDDGNSTIEGSSQIVESFRNTAEAGRARLDSLVFLHEINQTRPLEIVFIDVLRVGNDRLTVRHTMYVHVADDGLIEHLRLEGSIDEARSVGQFFEKHRR